MLEVTRDRTTGQIVCSTRGPFDEDQLESLLQAIALAPDDAGLIIDLSFTGTLSPERLVVLAQTLRRRQGPVTFRHAGPWHAPILRAVLIH